MVFLILTQYIFSAVPHISGKRYPNQPPCVVNPRVEYLYKKYELKKAPALKVARVLDTVGSKKIAVIIVDFRDVQFSPNWHIKANQNFQKFINYYNEVSFGQLKLQVDFFYQTGSTSTLTGSEQPFRMLRNASYYADNTILTLSRLVRDALVAAQGRVNSSDYDYVMVLHAGYGAETMPDPTGYIWSAYVWWIGSVYGFTDGTVVPEDELNASAFGVICHEFGHQLGLPDIYYQQYSIVGRWCLMDAGLWCGSLPGSSPAHLSCWAKKFLGWVEPYTINFSTYVEIKNIEENPQTIKLPILEADSPENEYFLLEYRKKTLFDSHLPAEGLLIWRIDESIASDPTRLSANDINSGVPHYGVCIVEADKTPASVNLGDSGDPFPGFKNVKKFVPAEYNVFAYNGNEIKLSVNNISLTTSFISLDITYGEYNVEIPTNYYFLTIDVLPPSATCYITIRSSSNTNTYNQFPLNLEFKENEVVEIEAASSSTDTFIFSNWSGDIVSSSNPIVINMDSNKYIVANFEVVLSTYEVSIDTTPPAKITTLVIKDYNTGYVLLSWLSVGDDFYQGNIKNGEYIIKYSTFYYSDDTFFWLKGNWNDEINKNSIVFEIYDSTPLQNVEYKIQTNFKQSTTYYFCVFTKDDTNNISEPSNVVYLYFPQIQQTIQPTTYYKLTIFVKPENSGVVVIDQPQLIYKQGAQVSLFAEPAEGYVFDKWTGDLESEQELIKIIMDSDKTLIANFKKEETLEIFKKVYLLSLNNDSINQEIDFSFADKVEVYNSKGILLGEFAYSKFNGKLNGKYLKPGIYIYKVKYLTKKYIGYIILIK